MLRANIKYAFVNNRDKSVENFSGFNKGAISNKIHTRLIARNQATQSYLDSLNKATAKCPDSACQKIVQGRIDELRKGFEKFKVSSSIKDFPTSVQQRYRDNMTKSGENPALSIDNVITC